MRDTQRQRKYKVRHKEREGERADYKYHRQCCFAQLVPDSFVVHLWPLPWPGKYVDQPWPDEIF